MPVPLKGRNRPRTSSDDPEEFRATLGEHLDELRTRIVRSVLIIGVGWGLGWFLEPYLYGAFNGMVERAIRESIPKEAQYGEAFRNITDMFMLKFKLSAMIGIVMTFPLIVLQIWGFIAPGLRSKEREPLRQLAPASVCLFALGAFFAYLILPAAYRWFISFLADFPSSSLLQEPGTMVFFGLKMMAAFGIAFQLPLFVYLLGRLGLLTAEAMLQYWRQAIVLIFFASAVLTPGADPFSMFVMGIPLVILFLISVYAVKLTAKNDRPAELDDLD